MYGVRAETEGLLFQIDPLRIVAWLVASGVVDDPGVTSVTDALRWLFRVTEPVRELMDGFTFLNEVCALVGISKATEEVLKDRCVVVPRLS